MNPSRIELSELAVDFAPGAVPYAVLIPPGYDARANYPLCLFLHGGGGSRQTLVESQPLFDEWWRTGLVPPMVVATASAGEMSFYLDHPDGRYRWETFIAEEFLSHLRARYRVGADRASTVICGISMGGYGALKIAFRRPERFAAVAALQPMVEPGFRSSEVGARNRFYYPGGGPDELVGRNRDAALFEANNPAHRARDNADAIRSSRLAIYIEVGDADLFNAHDGAEFLHRVLWDLDISHEYHLVRGADHVGPTIVPRLRAAFAWLGETLDRASQAASDEVSAEERAWVDWITSGRVGAAPPAPDSRSPALIRALRAQFEPARQAAAQTDPTTTRRYGILPPSR